MLELFSGGKSFSKFCGKFPSLFKTTSLDIDPSSNPEICCDILKWDYKKYKPKSFDIIWASPDCTNYSIAKTKSPRNIVLADKLVKKTLEIITYFKPKIWYIENPSTGMLKTRPFMANIPYKDVTYCKYDYAYMKPTRIWTNVTLFKGKKCAFDCPYVHEGQHVRRLGCNDKSKIKADTTYLHKSIIYSVPPKLIKDLLTKAMLQLKDWAALEAIQHKRANHNIDWKINLSS